jgi:hypothetical protein
MLSQLTEKLPGTLNSHMPAGLPSDRREAAAHARHNGGRLCTSLEAGVEWAAQRGKMRVKEACRHSFIAGPACPGGHGLRREGSFGMVMPELGAGSEFISLETPCLVPGLAAAYHFPSSPSAHPHSILFFAMIEFDVIFPCCYFLSL